MNSINLKETMTYGIIIIIIQGEFYIYVSFSGKCEKWVFIIEKSHYVHKEKITLKLSTSKSLKVPTGIADKSLELRSTLDNNSPIPQENITLHIVFKKGAVHLVDSDVLRLPKFQELPKPFKFL